MPLQMGISTDMTTVRDEDAKSSIFFVEDPGAQQFEHMYDAHSEPYMTNAYSTDMNDLSFSELVGDLSNVVQKGLQEVYQKGKETLQDVGIVQKTTPKQPPKPAPKPLNPAPQGEEGIKEIQKYLSKPSPLLQSFIGNARYNGEIDGKPGPKTQAVISKLEGSLADILGTNAVYGSVLKSSGPQDIESALQKVSAFRQTKHSRDERIYFLSKILITSGNKHI